MTRSLCSYACDQRKHGSTIVRINFNALGVIDSIIKAYSLDMPMLKWKDATLTFGEKDKNDGITTFRRKHQPSLRTAAELLSIGHAKLLSTHLFEHHFSPYFILLNSIENWSFSFC